MEKPTDPNDHARAPCVCHIHRTTGTERNSVEEPTELLRFHGAGRGALHGPLEEEASAGDGQRWCCKESSNTSNPKKRNLEGIS